MIIYDIKFVFVVFQRNERREFILVGCEGQTSGAERLLMPGLL